MGVLVGSDEETLPLYGKEVRGRRDQYHYYTTTPGDQVYPLPVTIDNRIVWTILGVANFMEMKLFRF